MKYGDRLQTEVLRRNALAQTPYTPQAARYLQTVPLAKYGNERLGNNFDKSTLGFYNPTTGAISINSKLGRKSSVVNTFRHEALHAMDANVNHPVAALPFGNEISHRLPKTKGGPYSADSYRFMGTLKKHAPRQAQGILEEELSSPVYRHFDPRVQDAEAFAHFGERVRSAMLKGPDLSEKYRNIYVPMSKQPSYSPVYPSPELLLASRRKYGNKALSLKSAMSL